MLQESWLFGAGDLTALVKEVEVRSKEVGNVLEYIYYIPKFYSPS
jgi:hypothetical protein